MIKLYIRIHYKKLLAHRTACVVLVYLLSQEVYYSIVSISIQFIYHRPPSCETGLFCKESETFYENNDNK